MSFILENTPHLQTLFSGLTISPESLIDSVIAMWVIINLPDRFKTKMEVWLGKCKVEKKSPSLDDTWEVIRKFLQHCENNNKHFSQALLASKSKNINNNQNKKDKTATTQNVPQAGTTPSPNIMKAIETSSKGTRMDSAVKNPCDPLLHPLENMALSQ
ncbi:hypothetical protein O181_028975 [Austropuccinia psidii MF-1]|uniref:Uncharacterized protein n=1 Tax=Austropuccinia psidii MF-1 TaxID=1389203 RepID=A0A9Q3CUE4_9BASI|nr:hypothetical protein [Austropuccinia psidii MF-1]